MDIVYCIKQEEDNEELRYSLRSLKNIPHRRVFFAGYMPTWVKGVWHIPVLQTRSKYRNTTDNLIRACSVPEVSDDFLYFNDDFFIMKPTGKMPVLNRGSNAKVTAEYKAKGSGGYVKGMMETEELLHMLGIEEVINYELHVPLQINKSRFLDIIQIQKDLAPHIKVVHKRTLYGNFWKVGGSKIEDVKVYNIDQSWSRESQFLSTLDTTFRLHPIGEFIRAQFPMKSPYER